MQGQFGATLPAVNVGAPQDPLSINRLYQPAVQAFRAFAPYSPLLNNGQPSQDYALRHPYGLTSTYNPNEDYGTRHPQQAPTPNGWQGDRGYGREAQMTQTLNDIIAAVENGDMSSLKYLPAEDLEAMGLAEFAAAGAGGSGIGTGIDEGRDMTPAQLEERYYRNKEVEAGFLSSKRWNEKKNKYETVGEYLRRERGKYNRKGRRKGGGRAGSQQQAAQAAEPQNPQFTVQQYGVVNFNTATG